jgi:hypothetical protein
MCPAVPLYLPNTINNEPNGILLTGTPISGYQATNKDYVDTNFIAKKAASQTIEGSLIITNDFTVKGKMTIQETETLQIKDNIIEVNSNKIDNFAAKSGVVINKNSLGAAYGILYDPIADSIKLGLGTNTPEKGFIFSENEGAPLATRQEFDSSWKDGAIFVFDKTTKKFIYSDKTLSSFKEEIKADMAAYIETYMSQTVLTYEGGSTALSVSGKTQEIQNENGGTTLVVGTPY